MSAIIRPYVDLEGIFAGIEYRANSVDAFQKIDIDDDVATTIVRVDDLRTIPQHQIRLQLDLSVLKPHYSHHKDGIHVVIIARDSTLRKEIRFGDFPLDAVPATIDLDRGLLRTTSLRDVLVLNIAVVINERLRGAVALPTQRASRLAELRFSIRNTAGGAAFPFKRVTADELKQKGCPPETGIHLELHCDATELLAATDTPIANLLEVWIHEKVWAAIQSDRAPASARLRMATVTLNTAHLVLSAVVPQLKDGQTIAEGSVIGRLLLYAERQASLPEGRLRKEFQNEATLHSLDVYLQNAWKLVSSASKIDENVEEQS